MPTINVDLPVDLLRFIEAEVSGGGFSSPSDLVSRAVAMMRATSGPIDTPDGALRAALRVGMDDLAMGRLSTRTARDIAHGIVSGAPGA